NPKQILELGTGAGYSTLWMLNGIDKSSKLISIDRNSELQAQAEKFVRRAGFGESQAEFVNGNSIEYLDLNLQKLKHFDLIFIDCDKVDYPTLLDFFITEKLNATLIFDNALWHGRIFSDNPEKPSDRAMVKFWEMIESSGREFTLFPAGDGLVAIGQTAFKTN
ncbi:MAG: class I SAM-dependent methyltransferase, partial [Leptospira sp.]|nr:class I SAM-dependent methyltransferase [Leptospira sp.]